MQFPKLLVILFLNQTVDSVIRRGWLKRRSSFQHDKKNDSSRKDICLSTRVTLFKDFRCLVSLRAQVGMQNSRLIFSLENGKEPQITYLQYKIMAEQDILWLQISMGKSRLMQVIKSIHHLVKVSPGNIFGKPSSDWQVVEKLSTFSVLNDDSQAFILFSFSILILCLIPRIDQFDQIFMVQLFHNSQFFVQSVQICSLDSVSFNSNLDSLWIQCQFDPGLKQKSTLHDSLLRES